MSVCVLANSLYIPDGEGKGEVLLLHHQPKSIAMNIHNLDLWIIF
jgi:hypothetical protein